MSKTNRFRKKLAKKVSFFNSKYFVVKEMRDVKKYSMLQSLYNTNNNQEQKQIILEFMEDIKNKQNYN